MGSDDGEYLADGGGGVSRGDNNNNDDDVIYDSRANYEDGGRRKADVDEQSNVTTPTLERVEIQGDGINSNLNKNEDVVASANTVKDDENQLRLGSMYEPELHEYKATRRRRGTERPEIRSWTHESLAAKRALFSCR